MRCSIASSPRSANGTTPTLASLAAPRGGGVSGLGRPGATDVTSAALAALLAHPAVWRGGDCAPQPDALPTGFHALDDVLPGGGWPSNALTEIVLAREGIGEMRLALPALAQLTCAGRQVVWIAPPWKPHAPALAAAGIALGRLALVRCRTSQ